MLIKNTKNHYGIVAISLHWIMAILIIGLLVLGLYMVPLPISREKLKLYRWHKEFGMVVLMLVVLRAAWRLSNIIPSLASLPPWEKFAARSVHYAFYVFMFAIPISGWIMSSAAGFSVSFFGLFLLPDLVLPDENLRIILTEIHKWLSYLLIAIIFLHISASLKHHYINKDDILRRMLWP